MNESKKTRFKKVKGGINAKNRNSGITLIALVVTIIVLLILAGISISMLAGDNGLLKKVAEAKEITEIAQEEENAKLTFTTLQMNLTQGKTIDTAEFQKIIDGNFGRDKATGTIGGNTYIITVARTGINYQMDSNGNINQIDELPLDMNPGVLEGKGTQDDPYVINSIEDLVALSYAVNTGDNLYDGSLVTLARDLDFKDDNSYANANAKYKYVENKGCIPDESSTITIKELMINTEGKGFTPIGYFTSNVFKGNFNGKGKSLNNMFANGVYGGLFGNITTNVEIKNLKLTNCNIKGQAPTGGIVGLSVGTLNISGCLVSGNIEGSNNIGGIIGQNNGTLDILLCSNNAIVTSSSANAGGIIGSGSGNIEMCYNTGKITSSSTNGTYGVGGIIGGTVSDTNIYNCYNTGDIGTETSDPLSGGIVGKGNNKVKIINFYNNGIIASKNPAGGIIGSCGSGSSIVNCYNFNSVTSKNSLAGGIIASGSSTPIDNCYNSGEIISKSSQPVGGIAAVGATVTNSYNTGIVSGESENITGYIIGTGSVNNTNKYQKQTPDIQKNGAKEFESEAEMNQIMDVQRFVDIMNNYVYSDEELMGGVQIWTLENNEFPVFYY